MDTFKHYVEVHYSPGHIRLIKTKQLRHVWTVHNLCTVKFCESCAGAYINQDFVDPSGLIGLKLWKSSGCIFPYCILELLVFF